MQIEKDLSGVKRNVLLKNYTTFKIGGPAKFFFEAKNKDEIIKAILAAKKSKLPFFILGGGSNLLVADKGYKGLVIKCQMSNVKCQNQNSNLKTIYAESGVRLSELIKISLEKSLEGLEWAVGIPGTVGGAVRGNAGAFNSSMAEIVKSVEILEIQDYKNKKHILKVKKFSNENCQFGYRDSIFKHKKNLIIISATLQLKKGNKKEIKNKIKKYLEQRKKTQPLGFPSAGSIFKNPPGKFAAELIEKCGLKGKRIGNVKISDIHANFIVNLGKGKAKDVKKLIDLIKNKVKKKFGIVLEEEIQFLGF
jgi:UDP-N-acetylmuramate dehydrogenase